VVLPTKTAPRKPTNFAEEKRKGPSSIRLGRPASHRRSDELSIDGPRTHSEVFLHVYDLHPFTKLVHLPIFHTGVEVHGSECSFGSHGLQWVHPGCMGPGHRQVVPLGPTHMTAKQVVELAANLSEDWPGSDYSIFNKNCQTFAIELCRRLGVSKPVPGEFVRFANWTR